MTTIKLTTSLREAEEALAKRLRHIDQTAKPFILSGDTMANIKQRELDYCELKIRAYQDYKAVVAKRSGGV